MFFMRAFLFIFLIFLMGINSAFAYDLVLPKEKKSVVSTNYAFFVGRANKLEQISINGENVYIATNGAFSHSVKLKNGENRIIVKSNFNTQVYKFYKVAEEIAVKPELEEFEPRYFVVKKDNTPLRSSPIDYGMNRISHLFEGTNLVIDGQKGKFYRVRLTESKKAWVDKKSVCEIAQKVEPRFVTVDSETFKNATKHRIEFSEKLPYTIEENEKEIIFKVYNPHISDASVYTVNVNKPQKYAYQTQLQEGTYLFKVMELPKLEQQTLEGFTVVIDAGHGGSEKGALGCLGDMEKNINLKIASELKEQLSLLNATVVMTRECDANVSLDDRVKIAKVNGADLFISVHLNSIPDVKFDTHRHRGTSVYYYNQNSKDLAKIVQKSIVNELGTRNDGVKSASFAVIRPTEYLGVLVEVAYMTNPIDSVLYTKEEFSQNTAKAIADGILNFVTSP